MAHKRSHFPKSLDKGSPLSETAKLAKTQLTWRKKLLFAASITLVSFCVLEILLWAAGVEPSYYQEDPYAGFSTHVPHFVSTSDDQGQQWLTVAPSKQRVLNKVRFSAQKPAGTYRIVCAGGSTTYGRPFFDRTSWAGWVRALLPVADPSRNWEVINIGAISYASYRSAGLMEEMAQYEPDLFIIYTGHNEFLERRTYNKLAERPSLLTDVLALPSHSRTSTLVRKVVDLTGIRHKKSPMAQATVFGQNVRAISVKAVGPDAYHRDQKLARDVGEHFRSSLERMTRIADRAGAEILLIVPASNLLDFAPFKSEHTDGLSNQQRTQWDRHFEKARLLLMSGRHEGALTEMIQAGKIDDRYADLLYRQGKTLFKLDRYDEAKSTLLGARDQDICPLRAISPLVETVRQVAQQHGERAVDFEQIVSEQSGHQLPGRAMFHDHVHLTVEANRLLGSAIISALQQRQIVHRDDTWNEHAIDQVAEQVESQIDRSLCARQLRALAALLASLGQPDQAQYQAELSLQLSGRTPEVLLQLADGLRGQNAWDLAADYYLESTQLAPKLAPSHLGLGLCWLQTGRQKQAIEHLQAALKLNPNLALAHSRLGVWLAGQGQLAAAEQHFVEAVRLQPIVADAHNNLGLAIARQGRYREALGHYQRALAIDLRSSSAHYNLGLVLEQLAQQNEARMHYRAALQIDPNFQDAQTRLQALGG
ncbi:MAG: tetratricopeptide repeat protein [Pirellulales bacterium]